MTLLMVSVAVLVALLIFLLSANFPAGYKEIKMEACRTLVDLERLRFESTAARLIDNTVSMTFL